MRARVRRLGIFCIRTGLRLVGRGALVSMLPFFLPSSCTRVAAWVGLGWVGSALAWWIGSGEKTVCGRLCRLSFDVRASWRLGREERDGAEGSGWEWSGGEGFVFLKDSGMMEGVGNAGRGVESVQYDTISLIVFSGQRGEDFFQRGEQGGRAWCVCVCSFCLYPAV